MGDIVLDVKDGNLGHAPNKKTAAKKLEQIVADYLKLLIKEGDQNGNNHVGE